MFEGNSALGFCMVLAIILFTTKALGLIFRKLGLPQVLGYIIAGLLVGPAIFGLAGVVLSTDIRASRYTDQKVEVNTYTMFAPVFFANIGISSITFKGLNPNILLFAVCAVLVGLIGKIIGCGAVCKAFKYNWRESAIGGVGMMARGEVALIVTAAVTNTALGEHALPSEFMIMTVLLILVSSILTPVFLKLLYGKNKGLPIGGAPETAMPQAEPNAEATAESSGQTEDNSVNDSQ